MSKRVVGIVTSSRADFGLLTPLIREVWHNKKIELKLYTTGMHYSSTHGHSIEEVRACEFTDKIIELPSFPVEGTPLAIGESIADGLASFSRAFENDTPNILLILGDRYDILPAAIAASIFNIPIAHISGGEITEGVIDDAIRHALTKLSHLHFPAHERYAERLVQMGEEPWRITVAGEPGLNEISKINMPTKNEFLRKMELDITKNVTIFTYHPETLEIEKVSDSINKILEVAHEIDSQIIFTFPNADNGCTPIIDAIKNYCSTHDNTKFFTSLGRQLYHEALNSVDCMVGNSSSGIVEAASFTLPVVNIGNRQKGRITAPNVISVSMEKNQIHTAWQTALSNDFRQKLSGMKNPFGKVDSNKTIMNVIEKIPLDKKLLKKKFIDLNSMT